MAARRLMALPFLILFVSLAVAALLLDYTPRFGSQAIRQIIIWVVVALGGWGFWRGYCALRVLPDCASLRRRVVLAMLPLWSLAVATPAFDSVDLAGYMNNGWLREGMGINPYAVPVNQVPGWYTIPQLRDHWPGTVCAYGFLFARLSGQVVSLAGGERDLAYLGFKLLNVLALALTIWFVDRACQQNGTSRTQGVFLVGWNPLILLHGLANGHNDLLSGLGLVAVLATIHTRWWWAALPLLAATALIKYSTIPLAPLVILFLLQHRGWKRTLASAIASLALVIAISWPFLQDGTVQNFSRNFSNVTVFLNSLGSVVIHPVHALGEAIPGLAFIEPRAAFALKALGGLTVLGLVGGLMIQRTRARCYSFEAFVRDAIAVQFVMIVIASAKFLGWYTLMFLPAVGILPVSSSLRKLCLFVSLAQLGSFTFVTRANVIGPLLMIVLPIYLWYRDAASHRVPHMAVTSSARFSERWHGLIKLVFQRRAVS